MKFLASRLSEGNKLFPAEIYIEEQAIKIRIPGFFSGDTKYINYENISAVEIDTPMIGFSTIRFFHNGNMVQAHGFSKGDAKLIKIYIDKGRDNIKKGARNVIQENGVQHTSEYTSKANTSGSNLPINQTIDKSTGILSKTVSAMGSAAKNIWEEVEKSENQHNESVIAREDKTNSKIEEIANIPFPDNKDELVNVLQYLVSIGISTTERSVKNIIIEKIEFGIMKLKTKDANVEVVFFQTKLEHLKKKNIFDYLP